MPKVVACLVVKSPKVFQWLGHMPLLNWSLTQLREVRGLGAIVCVAESRVATQAAKLLAADEIETVSMPNAVADGPEASLDKWLTAANGPACDADVVLVVKPTNPFLPAAKMEACVANVVDGRCSVCMPARPVSIITPSRRAAASEGIESVRAFRVTALSEPSFKTVPVTLIESFDVDRSDEYVVVGALVDSGKI